MFDTKYAGAGDTITTVEISEAEDCSEISIVNGRCKSNGAIASLGFEM